MNRGLRNNSYFAIPPKVSLQVDNQLLFCDCSPEVWGIVWIDGIDYHDRFRKRQISEYLSSHWIGVCYLDLHHISDLYMSIT